MIEEMGLQEGVKEKLFTQNAKEWLGINS
jgi:hypothetical protein